MRKILWVGILMMCVTLCTAESRQARNVYVVSGGGVSGSGQVKKVQLGAPVTGRNTKARSGVNNAAVKKHSEAKTVTTSAVVASGVDAEFRLREIYVYPNPAKAGKVPTFHIEAGIADSVKIIIYTVAAEEVHKITLTGLPAAINDGNGLDYAYEYAWHGHIPSGVYYYLVEAEKAGKKLRKTGKLAVVR